jgi:glutathione S-transferase
LHDSNIINEFLEESFGSHGAPLLPKDPYLRAQARLAIEFINKSVVPAYFRLLQAQPDNPMKQTEARSEFTEALGTISEQRKGIFFFGEQISLVDIAIAPWAVRDFIATDYRGFQRDEVPSWREWAKILEQHPTVRKTTSVGHSFRVDTDKTF